MKQQNRVTALYSRLSRDDEIYGDSSSIQTQKALLLQYAKQNNFYNIEHYWDDGYTGTSFNRPDFQRMIDDIGKGIIGAVIVKDLSRLGREYLQTGMYTEHFFPEHDVRFVAVDDNVDSSKGENEFAPFKNIMNEWYARDISKKVRSSLRARALQGKYVHSLPPYGYKKDPEDNARLIVDEVVAPVVKMIFDLARQGRRVYQIAKHLESLKILRPKMYLIERNKKYYKEEIAERPYHWCFTSIMTILQNRVYLGHIVSQKTLKKSFKSKKVIERPKDEWVEIQNMHEALVDQELFDKVQKDLSIKRREKKAHTPNIFAGKIRCADCGDMLHASLTKKHPSFSCATYKRHGKSRCSLHTIRLSDVIDAVLKTIRQKAKKACLDAEYFALGLQSALGKTADKERLQATRSITKKERRIDEIDVIIKKLYEDSVLGKISEERFELLTRDYETERTTLKTELTASQTQLSQLDQDTANSSLFASIIQKYKGLETLELPTVIELIDKVVVHETKLKNNKKTQTLDIYFNFIGHT